MSKMEYTVTEGERVLAKFVNAVDAEIFADALHAALMTQDKEHEQISVETPQRIVYIAGEYARTSDYYLRAHDKVGA